MIMQLKTKTELVKLKKKKKINILTDSLSYNFFFNLQTSYVLYVHFNNPIIYNLKYFV